MAEIIKCVECPRMEKLMFICPTCWRQLNDDLSAAEADRDLLLKQKLELEAELEQLGGSNGNGD